MTRRTMLAFATLSAVGPSFALGDDAASEIIGRLQGDWEAIEAEVQGIKLAEQAAKAIRITFKGDEVTVRPNGPDRPGRKSILKNVAPEKSPVEMDLFALEREERGKTQRCIISLANDRLQLCAPLSGDKRPTEFKTKAKDGFMLFTLKKVASK